MKRIYIALSLVLAALCFASVETGFISGKTDSFIAKIECADRLMSRLEFEDALKICEETEKEWQRHWQRRIRQVWQRAASSRG